MAGNEQRHGAPTQQHRRVLEQDLAPVVFLTFSHDKGRGERKGTGRRKEAGAGRRYGSVLVVLDGCNAQEKVEGSSGQRRPWEARFVRPGRRGGAGELDPRAHGGKEEDHGGGARVAGSWRAELTQGRRWRWWGSGARLLRAGSSESLSLLSSARAGEGDEGVREIDRVGGGARKRGRGRGFSRPRCSLGLEPVRAGP